SRPPLLLPERQPLRLRLRLRLAGHRPLAAGRVPDAGQREDAARLQAHAARERGDAVDARAGGRAPARRARLRARDAARHPRGGPRDLDEAMRTTFSAREFTADPLPDTTLAEILERARFAPSGGNRQGWKVIVVRERATREALAKLTEPAAKRYVAQQKNGENPWNTIDPPRVDAATIERTEPLFRLIEPVLKAPVVLVICVDLKVVASTDQHLDRVGVISGASIYPFAWNILLAARARGF